MSEPPPSLFLYLSSSDLQSKRHLLETFNPHWHSHPYPQAAQGRRSHRIHRQQEDWRVSGGGKLAYRNVSNASAFVATKLQNTPHIRNSGAATSSFLRRHRSFPNFWDTLLLRRTNIPACSWMKALWKWTEVLWYRERGADRECSGKSDCWASPHSTANVPASENSPPRSDRTCP